MCVKRRSRVGREQKVADQGGIFLLLVDGDVIRFGQSVRVYILRGADSSGNSAPVKKSWGRKLRVPRVRISSVVSKKNFNKSKASSAATKLVNAVCYGTLKDEKVVTFISGVLELGDEDRKVP